jgi:glycyl-tRNA synthetase (class II)
MANTEDDFKRVISHAKEYGYVFQSSEIYDGLSAVYDYGQNGAELKKIFETIGGKPWYNSMTILLGWMLPYLCILPLGRLPAI